MRGKCTFTKSPDNHEKAKKRQFGYCLIFAEKTQLSTFKAVRTNTLWPWKKGAKELKNSLCSTYYVVFSLNHSWCWLVRNISSFAKCAEIWIKTGAAASHKASLCGLIWTLIVGLHCPQFKAVCRVILCPSLKIQKKEHPFSFVVGYGESWQSHFSPTTNDLYKMSL